MGRIATANGWSCLRDEWREIDYENVTLQLMGERDGQSTMGVGVKMNTFMHMHVVR